MKISVSKKSNNRKFVIDSEIKEIGEDFLIIITGGLKHTGAISCAQFHRSISNKEKLTTTVSTLSCYGHKESEISATTAKKIFRNVAMLR